MGGESNLTTTTTKRVVFSSSSYLFISPRRRAYSFLGFFLRDDKITYFYRHDKIEYIKRFSKLTGDDKNSGSVDTDRRPAG